MKPIKYKNDIEETKAYEEENSMSTRVGEWGMKLLFAGIANILFPNDE